MKAIEAKPGDDRCMVLRIRASRRKARAAAVAEVLAVLGGLGVRASPGGPLATMSGIAWVTVPQATLAAALSRLRRLGYVAAIDLVAPREDGCPNSTPMARWKGKEVALLRVFEESDEALRAYAPDRRTFLLECGDGIVRPVTGYRGGEGPLEHRALAVEDARLLVNLAAGGNGKRLLDPFAGAGGIVLEAKARGLCAVSLDFDRSLRFGLARLSDRHVAGDARALPFPAGSFDAVASEPPYHPGSESIVAAAISEMARVTKRGGRIALLAASAQRAAALDAGSRAGLNLELEAAIDRKGTAVVCLCWVAAPF